MYFFWKSRLNGGSRRDQLKASCRSVF